MDVDVVVPRVLSDLFNQICSRVDTAFRRSCGRRRQRHGDGAGDGRPARVNVRERGRRDVRDGELEADLVLPLVKRDDGRAGAVRVAWARHFGRAGQRSCQSATALFLLLSRDEAADDGGC